VYLDLISSNKRRSFVLALVFIALLVAIGLVLNTFAGYGWVGVAFAVAFAGISAFVSYWKSDAIALRVSRAKPADAREYARLHNLVEGLCIASGLPKPRVYVIDDPAPNAFATGRNPQHAAIAVTTGLLAMMNRVELEGVVAHELSHIRHYDILVSTLAVTMVGSIAIISDLAIRMLWWNGGRTRRGNDHDNNPAGAFIAIAGFLLLILAPVIAQLLHFAVSRQRESLADLGAVEMTRYPPGLISALEKLQSDTTVTHSASRATAHMWIEQPVARVPDEGRMASLNRLFDTHPPLTERIAALREL
jgi:heat shock protein HtpX